MRTRTLPRHPITGIAALGWRRPRTGEDPHQLYPVWPIRGGATDDDGDGEGGDGGDHGDGDGDQGGDGDTSGTGDDGDVDWKAEALKARDDAAKWKAQSRKHEQRAKDNAGAAKEAARLRREGLPEQERAIDEAVAKAVAEANAKNGAKLARQAFLAAAKGALANPADVADDVNLSRYVDEHGEVDEEGLADLVKRLAPQRSGTDDGEDDGGRSGRRRGFDQGARGGRSKDRRQSSVAAGRDLYAERHGNKSKQTT